MNFKMLCIFGWLVLLSACNSNQKNTDVPGSIPEADVTVASIELCQLYMNDAHNADRNFKNRVIKVEGQIQRMVHKNSEIHMRLRTNTDDCEVICIWPGDSTKTSLKQGDRIEFIGRCKGIENNKVTVSSVSF